MSAVDAMSSRKRASVLLALVAISWAVPVTLCSETYIVWRDTHRSALDWHGQTRIELPLTLQGPGMLTFHARLDGLDEEVLVDSGAESATVDPELANRLDGVPHGWELIDWHWYPVVSHVPLQLGAATLELNHVGIAASPVPARVIIGAEIFLQAVVDLDLDAGRLTLIQPDSFIAPADEPVQIRTYWGRPAVRVHVDGDDRWICATIDTGFNSGLSLSEALIEQLNLPRDGRYMSVYTRVGGLRGETQGLFPIRDLQVGMQHLGNVPASEERKTGACGNLLGMDVLARRHVIFDVRRHHLWMLPRAARQ